MWDRVTLKIHLSFFKSHATKTLYFYNEQDVIPLHRSFLLTVTTLAKHMLTLAEGKCCVSGTVRWSYQHIHPCGLSTHWHLRFCRWCCLFSLSVQPVQLLFKTLISKKHLFFLHHFSYNTLWSTVFCKGWDVCKRLHLVCAKTLHYRVIRITSYRMCGMWWCIC